MALKQSSVREYSRIYPQSSVREYSRIYKATIIDTEGIEVTVAMAEGAADEFIQKMTQGIEAHPRRRPVVGIHVHHENEPAPRILSLNLCIDGSVLVYFKPQTLGPLLRSFLKNRVNIFVAVQIEQDSLVLEKAYGDGMSTQIDLVHRFVELYKDEGSIHEVPTGYQLYALCWFYFDKDRKFPTREELRFLTHEQGFLVHGLDDDYVTYCSTQAYSAFRVGKVQLGEEVLAVGIDRLFSTSAGEVDTKYNYDITIGDHLVRTKFTCHAEAADIWLDSILKDTPSPRFIALATGHAQLFKEERSFFTVIETIQFYLRDTCYIINLDKENTPRKRTILQTLLTNRDTTYFGINIRSTLTQLWTQMPLKRSLDDVKMVDLIDEAAAVALETETPTLEGANLGQLYFAVMGRREVLLPEVNLTTWEFVNRLDDDLIRYATVDAVMCYEIGKELGIVQ